MYNRRDFLKIILSSTISMHVMSSRPVFSNEKSEELRIGYLPITDATPLLIAHGKGFFKDEGLSVQKPIRVRSWSTLSESFITGKFNLTHMLFPIPIWMRYKNKINVKVLAWNHTNGSALTVRADSHIKRFEDLGGKQIAIPYWYSIHNLILQSGLKKVGLTPIVQDQALPVLSNQVNLFILPPPDMPLALSGNKIDGYIVAEPFNVLSEIKINAKILRFTGDIWNNHPCCVVVMQDSLIKEKPIFTQKVMNALVRAQIWINQHKNETAHILSREGNDYLPLSEDILSRVFHQYDLSHYGQGSVPQAIRHSSWVSSGRIGFQPYPYPSATQFIVEKMKHTLMEGDNTFLHELSPGFVANDLVEESFVKKAIIDAGGPHLFKTMDFNSPWQRQEIFDI